MHVGSRDAGARRPRVLNPMCIGMPDTHAYAGGVGRKMCGAAGWEAQARLRAGILMRPPVWVFVECLVIRHVSHPFHTYILCRLRINYIAGLQRRRKYTQPGNAIANPLYFDT